MSRRVVNTCGYCCEGIPPDDSNSEGWGGILTVNGLRRGPGMHPHCGQTQERGRDASSLWMDSGEGWRMHIYMDELIL